MTDRVDLVRSAYEAFGKGDVPTVAAMLAETEWHEAKGMPYGGVFNGAEEIFGNVLGPIAQDVEGFQVTPEEILPVGDDRVISLGRYTGKGANGPVDVRYAHLWTIRDETVVKFEQFADTKLFSDAVGK
jgi:ketosteroid isomerase-like protein